MTISYHTHVSSSSYHTHVSSSSYHTQYVPRLFRVDFYYPANKKAGAAPMLVERKERSRYIFKSSAGLFSFRSRSLLTFSNSRYLLAFSNPPQHTWSTCPAHTCILLLI